MHLICGCGALRAIVGNPNNSQVAPAAMVVLWPTTLPTDRPANRPTAGRLLCIGVSCSQGNHYFQGLAAAAGTAHTCWATCIFFHNISLYSFIRHLCGETALRSLEMSRAAGPSSHASRPGRVLCCVDILILDVGEECAYCV